MMEPGRMRSRSLLPLLLVVLVVGCGPSPRAARAPDSGEPAMRVMTYNVNFGLGGDPEALAGVRAAGADVVFLQETNAEWEAAFRRDLGDVYPTMEFVERPAAGGMGLLSRWPVREAEVLEPPPGGWFPAWRVVLATPLGPVQFLGLHLRPQISDSGSVVSGYFTTGDERLAEIRAYLERLDPGLPTLLLGDFNETTGGDALEHLAGLGYRSALNEFDPGRETWHWTTSAGSISFQFDHLVHDARLEPLEVRVLQEGRSDHLPVLGVFVAARNDGGG
ncbi:MAG: endonuclease/exonuclease/phosphatase family protein [Deltaproteobacteria bacterium]|nr:endonuclease/exonuclease/phosphatase family protein [Deltaproteobacteria bacterium]